MTPLYEVYKVIFGRDRPEDISEEQLAQLVIEGLSIPLHGRDLAGRCLSYIFQHHTRFSELVRNWAARDFDHTAA